MNLLLLEPGELRTDGRVVLADRRAEHLIRVLRVEPGRPVRAGVVGGSRLSLVVDAVEGKAVSLRVEESEDPVPRRWTVDVVVGLPRPQALHRLLQVAAGMEVRRLHLTRSWRVEKSYFHSPSLGAERIRRQLLLGAEQGATVHLPEVRLHRRFRACLEDVAGGGEDESPGRFLADPEAVAPLSDVGSAGEPVVLALGPEGGWIDRERDSFRDLGFRPFALGPWILKVEMAVTAALAQLSRLRVETGAIW